MNKQLDNGSLFSRDEDQLVTCSRCVSTFVIEADWPSDSKMTAIRAGWSSRYVDGWTWTCGAAHE